MSALPSDEETSLAVLNLQKLDDMDSGGDEPTAPPDDAEHTDIEDYVPVTQLPLPKDLSVGDHNYTLPPADLNCMSELSEKDHPTGDHDNMSAPAEDCCVGDETSLASEGQLDIRIVAVAGGTGNDYTVMSHLVSPNRGLNDDPRISPPPSSADATAKYCLGSLVWIHTEGGLRWPSLVVPDTKTGSIVRTDRMEVAWHVVLLEARDQHRWLPGSQLAAFDSEEALKWKEGRGPLFARAQRLAESLVAMSCHQRLGELIRLNKQHKIERQLLSLQGNKKSDVGRQPSHLPQLFRKPYVRLAKLKLAHVSIPAEHAKDTNAHKQPARPISDRKLTSCAQTVTATRKQKLTTSLRFEAGDLVWALVKGYPYWPALVYPEAVSQVTTKAAGKESTAVHVLFLASKKQTAWVKDTNIVTFASTDQFDDILADCPSKVAAQFRPSKATQARFEEAGRVAVTLLPNAPEERLELTFENDL